MKEGEEGKETMIMLNTKFNVGQNKRTKGDSPF
jgi:hypothetical protein